MKQLVSLAFIVCTVNATAQKASNKLTFQKGQKLEMTTQVKNVIAQEMMGQNIEFNVDATITNSFDVADVAAGNAVIEGKTKRMQFNFEGMGQSKKFDSENEADMKSEGGKAAEKSLKNKYTMTVDPNGKIVAVKKDDDTPNGAKADAAADPMAAMMGQIFEGMGSPEVGKSSVFKILPDKEVSKGETWSDSTSTGKDEKTKTVYTVSDINDATIIVDFTQDGNSVRKQEMQGMEMTMNMKNKANGKITLDKKTGLLKQKTVTTESTGTIDVMGQSMPMTTKSTATTTVKG